jgi:hypothetical protein
MNRNDYDRKIIAIFDTIGSFFIDVFYNDLYLRAREKTREGSANSITDAYRNNVINYMQGIKKRPDLYMNVVKKLHDYYQQVSGFGAIIFADFENKIISQFIPAEYFNDFTNKNKDKTLNEIITSTVSDLGTFILQPEILNRIIDNHLDSSNVSLLQDQIVEIFILQRENYYAKFAEKIGEVGNNSIDKGVLKKLKQAFTDETKKKVTAEADRDRAINMLQGVLEKIREYENTINALKRENEYLQSQLTQRVTVVQENDLADELATIKKQRSPAKVNFSEISKKSTERKTPEIKTPKPEVSKKSTDSKVSKKPTESKTPENKVSKPTVEKKTKIVVSESESESEELNDEQLHLAQQEEIKKRFVKSKSESSEGSSESSEGSSESSEEAADSNKTLISDDPWQNNA